MKRNLISSEELIAFESEVAESFNDGRIRAPIHLYDGNEEQLIRIFRDVADDDYVFCSWRSHYQCLLKGVPGPEVMKAIMEGNSISLSFPSYRVYSSAIVGGVVPIAIGVALGLKQSNSTIHVWCFMGDMTSETGIVHECVKYARAFDLPITFVIEDNNKSVVTDTRLTWGLERLTFESETNQDKVIFYSYTSKFPHAGAGKRINF
jgi:TPP-dependent pyruvate/acetoin dehydrogenase alpha subunit